MRAWLVRGFWMGVLHGGVQTGTAAVAVHSPEASSSVRYIALGLLVVAGLLWGGLDAWRGLVDAGLVWFLSGLVAGPSAGVLGVVGAALLVDRTGVEALGPALTGGAAFTALLVMVTGGLGAAVGRALPQPRGSH